MKVIYKYLIFIYLLQTNLTHAQFQTHSVNTLLSFKVIIFEKKFPFVNCSCIRESRILFVVQTLSKTEFFNISDMKYLTGNLNLYIIYLFIYYIYTYYCCTFLASIGRDEKIQIKV
jgi:hypothetical protein